LKEIPSRIQFDSTKRSRSRKKIGAVINSSHKIRAGRQREEKLSVSRRTPLKVGLEGEGGVIGQTRTQSDGTEVKKTQWSVDHWGGRQGGGGTPDTTRSRRGKGRSGRKLEEEDALKEEGSRKGPRNKKKKNWIPFSREDD